MTKVFIGLMTTDGDRLGHLVRGVQMLRSYGNEVKVISYSDVVHSATSADEPPSLSCLLECMSDATPEGLKGIARETEWSLGDEPHVLRVYLLSFGGKPVDTARDPFPALQEGKLVDGMTVFLHRTEFAKLCDWGQQLTENEAAIAGEWPSATGR